MTETITKNYSFSDTLVSQVGSYTIIPNPFNNTFTVSIQFDITNKDNVSSIALSDGIVASVDANGTSYDMVHNEQDIVFAVGETKHFEGSVTVPYNSDGTLSKFAQISSINPFSAAGSSPYALKQNLHEIMSNASNGHKNINGTWKNGYFWKKINGTWKRCLIWQKINGIWKKGK